MHLNARYYDPALGLFVQPDWFEVTEAGVGTNRYSYSFNDPVNKLDPGGNAVDPGEDVDDENDHTQDILPRSKKKEESPQEPEEETDTRQPPSIRVAGPIEMSDDCTETSCGPEIPSAGGLNIGAGGGGDLAVRSEIVGPKVGTLSRLTRGGPVAPQIKKGSAGGETAAKDFTSAVKDAAKAENPQSVCVYCRMEGKGTQVDHAVPKARSGNRILDNAQLACPHCNASKGARDYPVILPPGYRGDWPPSWWK